MPFSSRSAWLLAGVLSVCSVVGLMMNGRSATSADGKSDGKAAAAAPAAAAAAPVKGQLTIEQLGTMLSALGLKAERTESRYDFQFASKIGEEWQLSMSTVLSNDGASIWVMAWLDECPKNAAEVPRSALLRMLADNDLMGNGKFFAYVASNRRFVLQRVVDNKSLTSSQFREILTDLGKTVVDTYPHWNVAGWKSQTGTPATGAEATTAGDEKAASTPSTQTSGASKSAATSTKTGTTKR